ncbi:hypothetical protein CTAYLR_003861 [Chrysophaeum taylorii]|uniref:Dimethylaniline monooxygenase n=1 Tax=Chrysophaeum taylorii TaxID=2483200 RepID=A0AAD7UKI2_9STRA|nr:hypothetical protein CTAYLR_003861 [Chrysophaeum taylorii]
MVVMAQKKKRVCVVGAGPCGLVSIKELRSQGHAVTCYEASPRIGGVFSHDPESAYENLYLTISNYFMCYSDFPPRPEQGVAYWSKSEYAEYLDRYAEKNGLRSAIAFETKVTSAERGADGLWTVTAQNAAGQRTTELFDALVIATGSNSIPKTIPENGFGRRQMHSSEYTEASFCAGKRVVVVGAGESAVDIACDVAEAGAASTTVWTRRAHMIAPRFPTMMAEDSSHDEFEVITTPSQAGTCMIADFLEYHTISRVANEAPTWLWGLIRQVFWRVKMMDKANGSFRNLAFWAIESCRSAFWMADQALWITKNGRIHKAMAHGKIDYVVSKTCDFQTDRLVFPEVVAYNQKDHADEPISLEVPCDVIIWCTGYQTRFDWLKKEAESVGVNPRAWFKNCFPPGYGASLAFLGWARPHQGGIPQCAELLARYHALLLAGELELPADYAEIAVREGLDLDRFYCITPDLKSLVDYFSFMESVAGLVGCEPKRPSIFLQPRTFIKYWIYPNWAYWYRTRGPGKDPSVVDDVLARFPLKQGLSASNGTGVPVLGWPFPTVLAVLFALVQKPFNFACLVLSALVPEDLRPSKPGIDKPDRRAWLYNKSKAFVLHGLQLKWSHIIAA